MISILSMDSEKSGGAHSYHVKKKTQYLPGSATCRTVPRKKKVRPFFPGKFETYEIARRMIEVLGVPVPDARTSPNQPILALQYAGTFRYDSIRKLSYPHICTKHKKRFFMKILTSFCLPRDHAVLPSRESCRYASRQVPSSFRMGLQCGFRPKAESRKPAPFQKFKNDRVQRNLAY
jgi:hypothetical protein